MKKILFLIVFAFSSLGIYAQQKSETTKQDIILKLNGDEMKGKIVSMNETELKFVYTGETLEYTVPKSDVLKITFASGRVEVLNKPNLPSATTGASDEDEAQHEIKHPRTDKADHHGKVAILPVSFLIDNSGAGSEIGYRVQSEIFSFLQSHRNPQYSFIDPRTTNAMLIKANADGEKMMGFTMEEICDILGVEYVLEATVTENKGSQTSYSSGRTTSNSKSTSDDKSSSNRNRKTTTSGSTYSSNSQQYVNTVNINIYNDRNETVFSRNRRALLASTDESGYASPLDYVLKRCPLYSK